MNLTQKLKLLYQGIKEEVKDPTFREFSFWENVDEGILNYKAKVSERLTKEGLKKTTDFWNYSGLEGYFANNDQVQIALVLPKERAQKYILAQDEEGRDIIASFQEEYHSDIKDKFESLNKDLGTLKRVSGGYIKRGEEGFEIYGKSRDYGKADESKVLELLQKYVR